MTLEELQRIVGLCDAAQEGEWSRLPEGKSATFHVACNGVGLSVSRVGELKVAERQLLMKTARDELFVVALADVFACSIDQAGNQARKAGFAA